MEKRIEEQTSRLKIMGWTFIGLAIFFSGATALLPRDEANYWLSAQGKEGMYVLSTFLAFLGLYCLGAVWRRRTFL